MALVIRAVNVTYNQESAAIFAVFLVKLEEIITMRFYLACAASFALMLIVLRSCDGGEYVSVAQASSYHHGKGGDARKRLHSHHKYYGYAVHDSRHLRWSALSAAVPLPHAERDTAGTHRSEDRVSIRNGFQDDIMEPCRTPQQIIDDGFIAVGWEQ